jgi:hypothetical protein
MEDIQSRPYKPDPEKCCEACVFGTGLHAPWCEYDGDFWLEDFMTMHEC